MINVYPLNNLPYSPFCQPPGQTLLAQQGIEISGETEADLIVSSSDRKLLLYALKYGRKKKYLLWTDEPYSNTRFTPNITLPLVADIHIFNVYTGIYTSNHRWLPDRIKLPQLTEVEFSCPRVVAIFGYNHQDKRKDLKYKGQSIALNRLRTQVALAGHELGVVDIYGRNWPAGISKGESRDGDWRTSKLSVVKNYSFNLAFENTNWPYYCTEKIWDAIHAGCLPVYYGKGNAIYEDFPPSSFIDYSHFENPQQLFSYIEAMEASEFLERMNRCIDIFNRLADQRPTLADEFYDKSQQQLQPIGMQVGLMADLARVTSNYIHQLFT